MAFSRPSYTKNDIFETFICNLLFRFDPLIQKQLRRLNEYRVFAIFFRFGAILIGTFLDVLLGLSCYEMTTLGEFRKNDRFLPWFRGVLPHGPNLCIYFFHFQLTIPEEPFEHFYIGRSQFWPFLYEGSKIFV